MTRIKRNGVTPGGVRLSEITSPAEYWGRRKFLSTAGWGAAALAAPPLYGRGAQTVPDLSNIEPSAYRTDDEVSNKRTVTTYNNFYEFGTDKRDPARNSSDFKPLPWSVHIHGECEKPATCGLEDLLRLHSIEDRVYRFRCVEAWSMVIPWLGVPLGPVLSRFKPTSKAKYVAFRTVFRPKEMPGQRRAILEWPYVEGLRIDEAMHPLTILAVGMFGEMMPNQNGAPIRLVVPWKYGFKSIKSVVSIQFMETEPPTTWNRSAPSEYGFYSNVNPDRDHPRWSQEKERRIGEFFKRKTLLFNGYTEEVGSLYAGMDLQKHY